MAQLNVKPVKKSIATFGISGISPLVEHRWDEKSKEMMRQKGLGKKTKTREIRDPKTEAKNATYWMKDGRPAIHIGALRKALINAAHKDIGIEKTLVRKALFFKGEEGSLTALEADQPILREDTVRVGQGSADLRYRYEFNNWKCRLECEIDSDLLQIHDLMCLVNRAGYGVGLFEMRPEKGGEYGRFEIDPTVPILIKPLEFTMPEIKEIK